MAPKRPCFHFQRGRCYKGDSCTYGHFRDPNFQRKPCYHFAKGRCWNGDNCTFSHDPDDVATVQAPPEDPIHEVDRASTEARFKRWRYLLPHDLKRYRPLRGNEKEEFWQSTYELTRGEAGVVQDVIISLASDVGIMRIGELVKQEFFDDATIHGLASIFTEQLLPFFKSITNKNVTTSPLLEGRLLTICNIIYGGGKYADNMFRAVATHLSTLSFSPSGDVVDEDVVSAFESSLAAFAMVVQGNTVAQAHEGLGAIVEIVAALLEGSHSEAVSFALRNAKKHLNHLRRRFRLGEALPTISGNTRTHGERAFFELARDLPGKLSNEGPRHDNDHDNIRDISILPTLQEIQSSRNEYLPLADPREWHLGGLEGLLDRNFRLLREDTVGQLRDAAKFELERLRNPRQRAETKHDRRGIRTLVYGNVEVTDIAFDPRGGLEFALGFDQPPHLLGKNKAHRREWWEGSKRLGTEALICLLSSAGNATFFIVAPEPRKVQARDEELEEIRGRLQKTYNLYNDKSRAHVIARLVDPDDANDVIGQSRGDSTAQLSLVEFPGVLLPAFMPTLTAMQRLSRDLDVPFANILAPVSVRDNPERDIDVPPPAFATRPGFRYDLSTLTSDHTTIHLTPNQRIQETCEALQAHSTLDAGQAKALVSSLSRSLALIQGPPGTGKSYTGMEMIRALLANESSIDPGPILTVTFTNHALDQGLLRLIDQNVSGIIRIGGRSKSERLADVNLRVVAQGQEFTKAEKRDHYILQESMEKEAKMINAILAQLHNIGEQSQLETHLMQRHRLHWRQLFNDVDEDGFQRVIHHKERIVDLWLRGGVRGNWRPRPVEELNEAYINTMTSFERKTLHASWIAEIQEDLLYGLGNSHDGYQDLKKKLELIRTESDLRVLKQAKIVGCTTSGLARNIDLLRRMKPKVLVCEEAGEVLEAHLLTALLPSIEHAILIGDHQQLRPNVQNYDLSIENRSGAKYSLDVSLFERLVQPRNDMVQPLPFNTLGVQRRMHPSISQLVRRTIYPSLTDAPSVNDYPQVPGLKHRLFWMHHENLEDEDKEAQSTSHTNNFECGMVAALVSHLVKQGVYSSGDIAVLTPYLGQLRQIRKKLSDSFEIVLNDRDQEDLAKDSGDDTSQEKQAFPPARAQIARGTLLKALRVATVDNFQGEEAKVIVVSLVRSNKENAPGFLRTPNRINVLLSRAKHGMYIIGNCHTMRKVEMWANVIDIFKSDGLVGSSLDLSCPRHPGTPLTVQTPEDFIKVAPEAGCHLPCDKRLPCGHADFSKCHSDMLHNAVYCSQPCTRPKAGCLHGCPAPCGAECPRLCEAVVSDIRVTPPSCHHEKTELPCYQVQDPHKIECDVLVQRKVAVCGHSVQVECCVDVNMDNFRCPSVCRAILDCGHECRKSCSSCTTIVRQDGKGNTIVATDHGKCDQACGRPFSTCTHNDRSACHGTIPCSPCFAKCEVRCNHSKCNKRCFEPCVPCAEARCETPECSMPCAAPCNSVPKSTRCENTLQCGCRCPGVMGEPCPQIAFCQQHGTKENLGQIADFIGYSTFADIDLDVNPCIFTGCGHVFTIETLDGWMNMQEHYESDPKTGQFTKIKATTEPFSSKDLKLCPSCRGPLRNIARYGRIVRRAMLDESTKRFTVWSNGRFVDLSERLATEQGKLLGSIGIIRRPMYGAGGVTIAGTTPDQLKAVRGLENAERYKKVMQLYAEVRTFVDKLCKDEQPYQRVKDLVETARRQNQDSHIERFEVHSSELQLREHLQGVGLLIRCEIVLFSDVISMHNKTRASNSKGPLKVDLGSNRTRCEALVNEAKAAVSVREEVEGHVFWARLAALEYGCVGHTAGEEESETLQQQKSLNEAALAHLKDAETTCTKLPNLTKDLQDEITEVRRMLNEGTSESEMRMVVAAMAREFSGTGHWYRCANGHPFTVGECGMPMQLARCPACGAGIGGERHRPTAGVEHAHDIERNFGAMDLGR